MHYTLAAQTISLPQLSIESWGSEEAQANATLIAAAPEIAYLLRRVVVYGRHNAACGMVSNGYDQDRTTCTCGWSEVQTASEDILDKISES